MEDDVKQAVEYLLEHVCEGNVDLLNACGNYIRRETISWEQVANISLTTSS